MSDTTSTKRCGGAPSSSSSSPAKKKSKANSDKVTSNSPFEGYMKALNEFLAKNKHFLRVENVTGIPFHQIKEDKSKYSIEQMKTLRKLMMTKNRCDQLCKMTNLILKDQGDQAWLSFSTSFSYDVLDSWYAVKQQLLRKTPAQKLDILICYTLILWRHDYWMRDNEGDMDVLVKGLASAWKRLLKNSNDESLGWDLEYTKPGVMSLLSRFKSEIESYDSEYELGKFKYM